MGDYSTVMSWPPPCAPTLAMCLDLTHSTTREQSCAACAAFRRPHSVCVSRRTSCAACSLARAQLSLAGACAQLTCTDPHRRRAKACCQVVPELRCIDKYGDGGELRDEVMLCERDYGWLVHEEATAAKGSASSTGGAPAGDGATARSASVVRPARGTPLSFAELQAHVAARTLVVDLGADAAEGRGGDALGLLPPTAEVVERLRASLARGGGGRASEGGASEGLPAGSRRCIEMLLAIIAEREESGQRRRRGAARTRRGAG
jgi:hypothetical protein